MAAAADAERLWSDLDAHERELRREGYHKYGIVHIKPPEGCSGK